MFRKFAWVILFGAVFVCSVVSSLLFAQWLEHRYLPVVTGFAVDSAKQVDGQWVLNGHMRKVRDCRFVEVVAYHNDAYLKLNFNLDPEEVSRSRAEGWQTWGPWHVRPATASIRFVARHQCHVLWDSSTEMEVML